MYHYEMCFPNVLHRLALGRFLYLNIRILVGEIVFRACDTLAVAVVIVVGDFILLAVDVVVVTYGVTDVT